MKRTTLAAIVLATGACLISVGVVVHAENEAKKKEAAQEQEQEREVKESEVPAAALKTLKEQAAGATITEFAEEIEHGQKFYEGSFKSASGSPVDVLVTEAGALVEIEESTSGEKVPAAVMQAARKAAGDAGIHFEKKTEVSYEIKFEKGGRGHEILLTPDGRIIEHEEDNGDEEESREKKK